MATISTVDGDADAEGYEHADAQDCIWYASANAAKNGTKSATTGLSWTVQHAGDARQDGSRPDANDAGQHADAYEPVVPACRRHDAEPVPELWNAVQPESAAVRSLTDAHVETQGRRSQAQRLG